MVEKKHELLLWGRLGLEVKMIKPITWVVNRK